MAIDSMHGMYLVFNHHSKEYCNFEVARVSNIEKTEPFLMLLLQSQIEQKK